MAKICMVVALLALTPVSQGTGFAQSVGESRALAAKAAGPGFPWLNSAAIPREQVTAALNEIWSRGYTFGAIDVPRWSVEQIRTALGDEQQMSPEGRLAARLLEAVAHEQHAAIGAEGHATPSREEEDSQRRELAAAKALYAALAADPQAGAYAATAAARAAMLEGPPVPWAIETPRGEQKFSDAWWRRRGFERVELLRSMAQRPDRWGWFLVPAPRGVRWSLAWYEWRFTSWRRAAVLNLFDRRESAYGRETLPGSLRGMAPHTGPGLSGFLGGGLWAVYQHFPSPARADWMLLFLGFSVLAQALFLPFIWKRVEQDAADDREGRTNQAGGSTSSVLVVLCGFACLSFALWFFRTEAGQTFIEGREAFDRAVTIGSEGKASFGSSLILTTILFGPALLWPLAAPAFFERYCIVLRHASAPRPMLLSATAVAVSSVLLLHAIYWNWSPASLVLMQCFIFATALVDALRLTFVYVVSRRVGTQPAGSGG